MKAVCIREHGAPSALRLGDAPDPAMKADEVLVEVRVAAMNHLDLWVRKGVPGHKFPLPLIPGCDAAGVIKDVGSAVPPQFKPGDRVALMPGVSCNHCVECQSGRHNLCRWYGVLGETCDGTNAQYVAVSSMNLLPLPESMSFETAAAIPLTLLTAWNMLIGRAGLRPGMKVLIHGAGSGVSIAAIQIAKLHGAEVIATTSSEEKARGAAGLGADHVLNYRKQDVLAEVKRLTAKAGVDVVVDHIGEATWAASMSSLKKGGSVVTCGMTSGGNLSVHGQQLFFKSLSLLGSTMGGRGQLMEAFEHVKAGRIRPVVDRQFPLADIAAAHEYLETGEQFGKVLLIP